MDAMTRMDRSVETVVHDLEIILARIRQLKREIGSLERTRTEDEHILTVKELLSDLQARTEGIEAFVQACQKRAHREELPADDIDL